MGCRVMENSKRFDWVSLLLGVVFIIMSLVAFKNPGSDLMAIAMVFGIGAIAKGISEIMFRRTLDVYTGYKANGVLVLGILDIIIGVYLLFNLQASILALPYVFAIWFIVDSFFTIFTSDYAKILGKSTYYFTIIGGVVGVILGIMLFVNPVVAALTLSFLVGFYFMWTGIMYISSAFSNID